MVTQEQLKEQIYRYVDAPLNPGVNFDTGLYYEAIGQTAAALSFFLRCAELTEDDLLAYEALLKTLPDSLSSIFSFEKQLLSLS